MVTSQAGTHAHGAVNTADLGPLAWVLDETRKSIELASRSLKRFAHDAEAARGVDLTSVDTSQLRMARQSLHQVVGALDMVGQSVAALMVRGMEGAVQQFVQHPEKCSEETAGVLEHAGFALVEYLQSQLADKPRAALGLFPAFRRVQELAGADRVHPADLWVFPWRWMDPATPAAAQRIAYGPEVRSRLDQRVLKIMRHADTNAAEEVSVISLGLADGESARHPVVFWKLSAGFFEALAQSLIPMDVYTKRAASRILLQYTSMARGDHNVSERLAQDLLFFCDQAGPVSAAQAPVLAAVRKAWGLEDNRPVSYEKATFGLYDPSVLAQARRRVEAIKENWSALAGGDMARAKACVDQFGLVTDSLIKLHAKGKPLAAALARVAEQTAHSGHPPSPELAMETATAVLFLEASFADFQPSDVMFTHRLNQLAQRLDVVREGGVAPALEPWMEELYRRVSDRQTMGTVIGELRATLGETEQHLDQFFRNPADKQLLATVPGLLSQMKGVLSVLGLEQAALAVARMRDTVDGLLLDESEAPSASSADTFERLGNSMGALGFLVDMLDYQPVLARKLFIYDEEAGELKHVSGRITEGLPGDAKDALGGLDIELELGDDASGTQAADQLTVMPELSLPADMLTGQLEQMAKQAALDDKPALAQAANRAAAAARQDSASLPDALQALQAVVSAPVAAQQVPDGSVQDDASDEDDDLLDIFLEEAREVVQNGLQAIQALALAPADMEQQTTLRRAFHTLKGSSRMVGLAEFGEAAWSMEQLLNAWLADPRPVSEDLRSLADEAMQAFGRWVEDIAAKQAGGWQAAPFKLAADALRTQGLRVPLALDVGGPADVAASLPLLEPDAPASALLAGSTLEQTTDADAAPQGEWTVDELPQPQNAATDIQVLEGLDVSESASIPEDPQPAPDLNPAGSLAAEQALAAFDLPDLELTPPPGEDVPAKAMAELAPDLVPADGTDAFDFELPNAPQMPAAQEQPASDASSAAQGMQAAEMPNGAPTDWALPLELSELDFTDEQATEASGHNLAVQAPEDQPPHAQPDMLDLDMSGLGIAVAPDAAAEPEAPLMGAQPSDLAGLLPEDDAYRQIGELRVSTPLFNVYLSEADEWSRQLMADLADWAQRLDQPVSERAIACAHSLAGSSATVGFSALSEMARAVEHALQRLQAQAGGTPEQARVLTQASEDMRHVLHQFAAGILKVPSQALQAEVHALEPLPSDTQLLVTQEDEDSADVAEAVEVTAGLEMPDDRQAGEAIPAAEVVAPVVPAAVASVAAASVGAAGAARPSITDDIDVADAVDPDLFPIFEEEAEELMPALSAAMREWISQPQSLEPRAQVLRALHTLKGSARLSGALRLGEVAHRIESAIETIGTENLTGNDLEPVQEHIDDMLAAFRRLQAGEVGMGLGVEVPAGRAALDALADMAAASAPAGQPEQAPPEAAPVPVSAPVERGTVALPAPLSMVSARAAASQAVRVRSQLLDRLVAQAGEVVTSRARLEAGVGQLRNSLNDLTGNLERLRQQLRDVELQAETQMQSRLALSKDAQQNFDPLEFDRFTRMQELTRMMAESVNDVATVQRTLQRAVEASEDDLAAQARQSRELQRDLLRTRMVEFESLSERLYRVVRQASKETGKQVRLDIVGGAIEMDRGILERMTPAFEHLLRNCVVHGIENQAMREARDKPATGLITIEVQQAGNDVAVEFRDDGAGLNLSRIRERALQQGLIASDQRLTDAEVGNLIFAPGFTTATEVTELAGRGVGMDVVRTEVQALGGRIETSTREGRGSSFRLVLPLTTAVTHVVMVRAGGLAVGVPSNLVEIVQRAGPQELQQAYESGQWRMGEETLPFFWSGALLQNSPRSTEPPARTVPVVIFRSAAQRVAVHVDEVLGNQEVVVKALGSQLSRLPGLVAITALASGAVALIYNPVALAAVYGDQARAMSVVTPQAAQADVPGAPADPAAALPSDIPLVLVVDDSITVRRVTQRLLQREGYRVALAADGLQGLERLQAERPAVVLSDIEMPRMDGFDFVRNIRADEQLADLPVIMITSRIAEKHREHARDLGVNHYLGKPYSEDELLGLIREYTKDRSTVA